MALTKIRPEGLDIGIVSSGGTITSYESGGTTYRVHTFLSGGVFQVNKNITADFLIVAGGGGSAAAEGYNGSTGGGGAGGLVEGTSQTLLSDNYIVVVGDGGAKSTNVAVGASDGGNSTFNGFTATGGAGGGDYEGGTRNGGSGAGGSEDGESGGGTTQNTYSSTTNVTGYGNVGGNGGSYPAGGGGSGGGAGGAGGTATGGTVAGGAGRANSFRTGSNVTYSTGGQAVEGQTNGVAGGANTGDGAGGVSTNSGGNTNSADGGSGIVVIRYAISQESNMPYIGKSPHFGIRNRYVYQATAAQTSFTGSDANSLTLSYADSLYMDVYQNGVLLKAGTDYTATTGTSVVLVSGALVNDIIEMIVYDTFSVNDSYTKTEADNRYPFLGNDSLIRTNGQTVSADITIGASTNGMSVGPISTTATITVNGYWTIV